MGKDRQHGHRDGIGLYKFVCWRFVARLTPIQKGDRVQKVLQIRLNRELMESR